MYAPHVTPNNMCRLGACATGLKALMRMRARVYMHADQVLHHSPTDSP